MVVDVELGSSSWNGTALLAMVVGAFWVEMPQEAVIRDREMANPNSPVSLADLVDLANLVRATELRPGRDPST
ncbi:MAG: hypothetical protein ACYCV7_00875 [Acidimicrobiales bacterium]